MKTSVLKPCLLAGLVITMGAFSLHAADLTWDADTGTTGAQDGTGTWNTALNNWWDGAANVIWNNATPDNAIFGAGTGAAGVVTVPSNTTNTVGNITFNAPGSGGHNIAAGSSTTSKLDLSGTPTITVSNGVFATNLVVLSGTSFTKLGAGTFVLKPGAPNINSGPTVVGEGTLVIGSTAGRLLIPGNLTVTNGAIAQIGANEQISDSAALTVDGGTFDMGSRTETVNGVVLDNNGVILSSSSSAILTSATGFDVRSGTIFAGLAGPGGLTKTTGGTVLSTNSSTVNSYTGGTLISAGILDVVHSGTGNGIPAGLVTITNTGMLRILKDNQIALAATLNVAGGTLELLAHNDNAGTVILDNGGQILNGGSTSKTLTVSTNMDFRNGLCATVLGGAGGMVKSTAGTVTLTLDNTYSGGTLVSGGILQVGDGVGIRGKMGTGPVTNNSAIVLNRTGAYNLTNTISGSGSITNLIGSPSITADNSYSGGTVVGGGTLFAKNTSGSATGSGAVTVPSGTLAGNGIISGPVTIQASGSLAPGNSAIGTLTINNALTLGGTFIAEVNTGVVPNTDQVAGTTAVNYGGTLQIVNLGAALTASDTFQIFPAGIRSGVFAILPATPDNNPALAWNTSTLTTDGTLRISSVGGGGPNTTPTNLVSSVGGGNLTLTWPTDYIGWTLQTQTNNRSIGLVPATNAWFDVAGSTTTNQIVIPISVTEPTVFYRLMLPIP